MSWDSVPWAVGGGALHSPEVGRLLAYAATAGSEGVVGSADLRVHALSVPGGSVLVDPGAAVIRNRSVGGGLQTYIGRLISADVVGIAATTSAGGRNDMVVARVEDPYAAGTPWQAPADPTVGPYVFSRVIPNVPASAIASPDAARKYLAGLGYSAIPLAGITIPASTATIQKSMIKSLREMANPRRKRDVSTCALFSSMTETQTASGTDGEIWPNAATNLWGAIEIPEWATVARVVCTWAQVKVPPGNVAGTLWVQLGADSSSYRQTTQAVIYDTPGLNNNSRSTFVLGDRLLVPSAYRGTNQSFRPKARWSGGAAAGRLILDGGSAVIMDFEFLEAPTEDDS